MLAYNLIASLALDVKNSNVVVGVEIHLEGNRQASSATILPGLLTGIVCSSSRTDGQARHAHTFGNDNHTAETQTEHHSQIFSVYNPTKVTPNAKTNICRT